MQKLASSKRVRRDFAVIRKNTAAVVNAQNKTGKGRKHCVQTEQLFLGQVTIALSASLCSVSSKFRDGFTLVVPNFLTSGLSS